MYTVNIVHNNLYEAALEESEDLPAHSATSVPENVLLAPRVSQLAVLAGGTV